MYFFKSRKVDSNTLNIYSICLGDVELSYLDFMQQLVNERGLRRFVEKIMIDCPFDAFFFETPAVTLDSKNQAFQFVLINSKKLETLKPNWQQFSDKLINSVGDHGVASFENFSKDATLIVPYPNRNNGNYNHLKSFLQNSPCQIRDEFWVKFASITLTKISSQPTWVSTAGLGVPWVHLRISKKPKYYNFLAYKSHVYVAEKKVRMISKWRNRLFGSKSYDS